MPPPTPRSVGDLLSLINKGVRSVLSGNFYEITEWLKVQYVERVDPWLGGQPSIASVSTPFWIEVPESAEVIRQTVEPSATGRIEGNVSNWYTVLGQKADSSCTLQIDEDIEAIDLSVVGI